MRAINGLHLIIDGYVEDSAVFTDEVIFGLFRALVEDLKMEFLTQPTSVEVPLNCDLLDSEEDEGGTSYWCQITTSHIALHAWPLRKSFMMDLFSCKPFNQHEAFQLVKHYLGISKYKLYELKRTDPAVPTPPDAIRVNYTLGFL